MKARIVWLILCGIWGSTWLFIKLGLENLPPLTFAGIRFVLASLILTVLVFIRRAPLPKRKDWLLIVIVGILQFTFNYGLVFWGEQHISSGLAAVLQATFPVFGLVIAHFYLPQERMTLGKVIGVGLGVFGVAVIFSEQLTISGRMALFGSVALVMSAFFGSYSNVLVKAYGGHIDPMVLAAGQMFFGFIPLLGIGIPAEGNPLRLHWSTMAVVALLYLVVVGSVMAFALYYWLMRNMAVTNTMLIALVTPAVAVILGMVVLGERFNWRLLAGGACIISGLALIVWRKKHKSVSSLIDEAAVVSER